MLSAAVALLALAPSPAHAFCGAYAGSAGTDLYNSVSEVAVVRQGTRTTLSVANDVEGSAGAGFAMLIPVPEVLGEDDVHVLDPGDFSVLDAYTRPRLVEYTCDDFAPTYTDPCDEAFLAGEDSAGWADSGTTATTDFEVEVEAQFVVGEYEIVILSAEESDDLFGWLWEEGFAVSSGAEALVQEYLDGGAYFFAAKVSADAGIGDGDTLSPLQFSYDSDVFSLPIRIGTAASKGQQDLIVYAITDFADGAVGISNYPEMSLEDECMLGPDFATDFSGDIGAYYVDQWQSAYDAEPGADWMTEYAWGNGHCDPCTGEQPDEQKLANLGFDFEAMTSGYFMTRLHMRYTPEEATQDVTFYLTGRTEQQQQRYIDYVYELEDRFPICGIGMVDDPGTCAYPADPYPDECLDAAKQWGWAGDPSDEEVAEKGGCATVAGGGYAAVLLGLLGLGARRRRG